MFKKLVENLPFNPGLINQIGFYAGRLKQEKSIRRTSFVFMTLAMVVQSFAFISPPVSSLTYSPNHILSDVQNKSQILSAYDNNTRGFRDIYKKYNISRADLASLSTTPNVTIRSNDGNNYRTIGRTSLWSYSKVSDTYKRSETKVIYSGTNAVYERDLRAWDIVNSYNSYRAFKGTNSATGQTFWILAGCGNITWVPPYKTPPVEPAKPELEIRKTVSKSSETLRPGDTFKYRIEYRNKVTNSVAEKVIIRDELDVKNFDVVSPKDLNISASGVLLHSVGDLRGSDSFKYLDLTVRLKNPLPSGTKVCNAARIQADNATPKTTKDVCVDVIEPCPYDPTVPNVNNPNCVKPVVICKVVDAAVNLSTRKVTFKTTVTSSNENTTTIKKYDYNFGDDTQASFESNKFTHETMHTYEPGSYTASVKVSYSAKGVEGVQTSEDCTADITFEEDQPFGQSKTVKNITKELEGEEAVKSKVSAGDVLEYTLTTVNTQNYGRTGVLIEDYIGDILDYAELDEESVIASKGQFNEDETKVLWENITIPANSEVEVTFRVTLKDPIPSTNQPTTSANYDCQIENTYGDIISLNVDCPAVKGIEAIPNTGPGTSIIATTAVTMAVGYFFARSRLLNKELELIRNDFATSGGM